MSKLLHKPLKAFIVYALVILVCSIPAYYYLVDSIWLEELDEHNQIVKEQTESGFNRLKEHGDDLKRSIALWNEVQPSNKLLPASANNQQDSIYTVMRTTFHNGSAETDRYRGLSTYVQIHGQAYHLSVETNVEEADETVLAISFITCIFIVLLIVGFILLNRHLSKRIWGPFWNTLDKLKHFDLNSSYKIDFSKTDIEEFEELNQVLSKLVESSILTFRQQKEFTQNASHELQTPLALLKSKIDLLIQDASLTSEQRQIIESLDASVARVTRLNKNLLLLAGIENKEYSADKVDLSTLLSSQLELFREFAEIKNHAISASIEKEVWVKSNESLLEILVTNLLSNAIRHSSNEGNMTVALDQKHLTVSNSGPVPLNEHDLFKRFISASSHNPGTGLGLAIIMEISEKYNWKVSYTYEQGNHIFSVNF